VNALLKTCSVALAVVVLATLTGCDAAGSRGVRIGAVLPLTGDIATYGQKMKKGIDLAVKHINTKGGVQGKQIAVLYEDDQGDPKASIAAVLKLITVSKVSAIIGGAISATALPCVPVIDQHKVVLFSPAATTPKLSGMSKYFFRNWPPDVYDGTAMGDFAARTLHLKRVSMLYVNNEWGVAISKIFSDVFQANGGAVGEL
jgi:branched-chain amino acid transport system substrate-binding protein